MKTFIFLALVGFAAAECPNACSGHGTCGAKDSCSCYQNYQGNDCSERTCYFGIAHVDSPKGDLNADGYVSGPLTTVVTGSEVYPWGTTEQFPNADANEGHFYMECSNKGICDRKSGQCDCFDGYTGTACARAACPNDCSGHGTCESIKELAEMRSFDTNEHDVPSTRVAGSDNHHNFDSAIEESYSYNLWDQDKTMGCKCDPVYYGADCSLKKCKYGVDPLFYDNTDGVIRQTTVIHVGSNYVGKGDLTGTFKIVFYDVFGEKYVTKGLAAKTATATDVKLALQALPNGVISSNNQDVTQEQPNAVTVSKATTTDGTFSTEGGIGGGLEGTGAGLGTHGGYGSEFTITFKSNPGVLKSIELDTRDVKNPGTPDYWVANARQGQFASRYTNSLGRVNTLKYGSKLVYTNTDLSTSAGANTLVKIGGQEFRVTGADANRIVLDEPFLGASINPTVVDTGATGKASGYDAAVTATLAAASTDVLTITGVTTEAIADSLQPGATLYVNNCPMTAKAITIATGGTPVPTPAIAADSDATAEQPLGVEAAANNGHDCGSDVLASAQTIYRRSDDPTNQNMYKTSGDTAVAAASGFGLAIGRGSSSAYLTKQAVDGSGDAVTGSGTSEADVNTDKKAFSLTVSAEIAPAVSANDVVFANGLGPFTVDFVATTSLAFTDSSTTVTTTKDKMMKFFATVTEATWNINVQAANAQETGIVAGTVLLIGGRRYRVRSRATDDGTSSGDLLPKMVLGDNYAGGQLRQVCSGCVTAKAAAAGGGGGNHETLSVSKKLARGFPAGSQVALGKFLNVDYLSNVKTAVVDSGANAQTIEISQHGSSGAQAAISGAAGAETYDGDGGNHAAQDLFVLQGFSSTGISYSVVTEAAAGTTYQYVAQCSNRGSCDASTGLCKCFKGYSNDNCDTQNMLAA